MIGKDKCIFKQSLFTHKHWILPDVTSPPMPKEKGQGIMLSALVSQEFSFGPQLTKVQLQHINQLREEEEYLDKDAAMKVYKTTKKQKLTSSPFVAYFQYSVNQQGYWDFNTMILQFEDVVDTLKSLFGNTMNTFLF